MQQRANSFQAEFPQVIHSTDPGRKETGREETGRKGTGRKGTNNERSLVALVGETLLGMTCPPTLSKTVSSG